jgi:hypothetical protein
MTKKLFYLLFAPLFLLPSVALAVAIPGIPAQIGDINILINAVLNLIWPLFIAFAVIMFIIAGFMFLRAQGEPNDIKQARNFLIWGVVGVAVGVMAFTIPYFIQGTITGGGVGGGQCLQSGIACNPNAGAQQCCSGVCGVNLASPTGGSCF